MNKPKRIFLALMLATLLVFSSVAGVFAASTIYVGNVGFDVDTISNNAAYQTAYTNYVVANPNAPIIVNFDGSIYDANAFSNAAGTPSIIDFAAAHPSTVPAAGAIWNGTGTPGEVTSLAVSSVSAISNTKVAITFNAAVPAALAVAANFSVKAGTATLAVSAVGQSADGKVLTLTTAAQTTGTAYTITISNFTFTTATDATQTFVGALADTTAPSAVAVSAYNNTTLLATFTEANRLDTAVAETIGNYTVAGLTVSAAKLLTTASEIATYGGTAYKSVLITISAQTAGSVYTLSASNIKDVAGNTITAALTSTFAGKGADTTAPTVSTVAAYNNAKLIVTFSENVDEATAETIANFTIAGLTPTTATLLTSATEIALYGGTINRTVLLETPAQTAGTVYTVSVLGVKDIAGNAITTASTSTFAGKGADATAPTVTTAASYNNTAVVVTFSENVDATTANTVANYTIAGLTPTAAALITTTANATVYGGTANRSVVLTVPAQTAGTVYTVSVLGVKDTSANAITTASTATFAGKAADVTAPTITSVTGLAGNQVQIVFSEAMDSTSVQTLTNYSITTLGTPLSVASWTASTKTLVLNTATQSNGVIYTLTTTGVKDTSGNTIAANATNTLAGIGTALDAPAISTVTALDSSRIKVVFNKVVTGVAITDFQMYKGTGSTVDTLADNTGEAVTALTGGTDYIIFVGTAAADLLVSDVYTLKITASAPVDLGGTALSLTDATMCSKTFGGLDSAAVTPAIVSLSQTDARTIVATFNQEVSVAVLGATTDATVTYGTGPTTIASSTTTITRSATDKTKVTFVFASDIAADQVAKLNILAASFGSVKDISANISMVKNATTNYEYQFGTQAFTTPTLAVSSVTCVDEQTLEIAFNQGIVFTNTATPGGGVDNNFATLVVNSDSSAVTHDWKYLEKTAADKLRVHFTSSMVEGTIYKFSIADNGAGDTTIVSAITGTALDAATVANASKTFGYVASVNAEPYLVSATPLSATVVQLTFSESLDADPVITTNLVFKNGTVTVDPAKLAVAAVGADKKIYTVTLTDGVFLAGTTYTIQVVAATGVNDKYGVDALKTTNGTTVAHISFGGAASALANTVTVLNTSTTIGGFTFATPLYLSGTAVANAADVSANVTETSAAQTLASAAYATATNRITATLSGAGLDDETIVLANVYSDAAGNLVGAKTIKLVAGAWVLQ